MPPVKLSPQSFLIDGSGFEGPWTGIAKVILGLYNSCLEINPQLHIVVLHRRPLRGELPATMRSAQWGARLPNRFWRPLIFPLYARLQRADVIHFPWNFGIPRLLTGTHLTALTLHDVIPISVSGYFKDKAAETAYRRKVQLDLRRADLVMTDSYFSQQRILQEFQVAPAPIVIHPASQMANYRLDKVVKSRPAEQYFFYCGGYDPRKGLDFLAETMVALWRAEKFNVPLYVAGEINYDYVSPRLAQIMREGAALGAIRELGYVADAHLVNLYRDALALIYPSRYEGFGMPPLEAMTLGCPVITYPLTSLPEVCGAAALYLDPNHGGSLREAILKLATDDTLRESLTTQGYAQAAKFSWLESAAQFLKALADTQHQSSRVSIQ